MLTGLFTFLCGYTQIVKDAAFKIQGDKIISVKMNIQKQKSIPFVETETAITGLSISGNIEFTDQAGFVRVVLVDLFDNEYLVMETCSLLEFEDKIRFENICEETAALNHVYPASINIESEFAQINLSEIQYSHSLDSFAKAQVALKNRIAWAK